jgi:hypothetical protein
LQEKIMDTTKQPRQFQPQWWSVQHTTLWQEQLPVLRADFERRSDPAARQRLAQLGPDDAVVQNHPVMPRNIDVERAHLVPDNDWEVGTTWEQLEPALRFGVGARAQYLRYERWTVELEVQLRQDWEAQQGPGAWDQVKGSIRRGFESARRPS